MAPVQRGNCAAARCGNCSASLAPNSPRSTVRSPARFSPGEKKASSVEKDWARLRSRGTCPATPTLRPRVSCSADGIWSRIECVRRLGSRNCGRIIGNSCRKMLALYRKCDGSPDQLRSSACRFYCVANGSSTDGPIRPSNLEEYSYNRETNEPEADRHCTRHHGTGETTTADEAASKIRGHVGQAE